MKIKFGILILAIVAAVGYSFIAANKNKTLVANNLVKKILKTEVTNEEYKAGDIVFQESNSMQCQAVKAATGSQWSHCGIILPHNGKLQVLEAVQPVQWESIKNWKARSQGGVMKVKRLIEDSVLTEKVIDSMVKFGQQLVGKNYDIYFNWSDEEWYCSELVWKIYDDALKLKIGTLKPLRDFNLSHPIVKKIMKQRYGNAPPMAEMMISPGAIFESCLLEDVSISN